MYTLPTNIFMEDSMKTKKHNNKKLPFLLFPFYLSPFSFYFSVRLTRGEFVDLARWSRTLCAPDPRRKLSAPWRRRSLRMRSVYFLLSALQILPECGIARRAEAGSRDIDVGGKNRLWKVRCSYWKAQQQAEILSWMCKDNVPEKQGEISTK